MRDNETLTMNGSAEAVAYRLLLHVMEVEGRPLDGTKVTAGAKLSRNLILDAYADCLDTVRGNRQRRPRMAAVNS